MTTENEQIDYYFVSYHWTKGKKSGYGQSCCRKRHGRKEIIATILSIQDATQSDRVTLLNWVSITKADYDEFAQFNSPAPKVAPEQQAQG